MKVHHFLQASLLITAKHRHRSEATRTAKRTRGKRPTCRSGKYAFWGQHTNGKYSVNGILDDDLSIGLEVSSNRFGRVPSFHDAPNACQTRCGKTGQTFDRDVA
jgi:hypothetical protein